MKNKTNSRVRLDYIPSGVFEVGKSGVQVSMETVEDSSAVLTRMAKMCPRRRCRGRKVINT